MNVPRIGLGLLAVLAACGGSQKSANSPTTISGPAGVEDLKIPKVDPKLCDINGKKVTTLDLNQDGKPDMWKLYEEKVEKGTTVDILTCKQVDLNLDGKKDYVAEYDEAGNLIVEEYDFDFDGKFDARIHYDKKTGKKYLVERMSGFSGQTDIWEKYDASERLESVRRDRDGDGKPDYWETYRNGVLDTILYDDDGDGKVDRKEEAHPGAPVAPVTGGPMPEPENTTASPESEPASAPASAPAEPTPAPKKKPTKKK